MYFTDVARNIYTVEDNPITWEGYKTFQSVELSNSKKRYQEWSSHANQNTLLPTEYLLPRIVRQCSTELPAFMHDSAKHNRRVSDHALKKKIEKLQPWGFYFKLREGIETQSVGTPSSRVAFRSDLISGTIEGLLGKRLHKMKVLDLGCNSGLFTMDLASRHAKHVHGVDLRKNNIKKAKMLASYYGITNVSFSVEDVYDFKPYSCYDVVLNLGLLYHVTRPVELVRKTYDMCNKVAVFDTICHKEPISAYLVSTDKDNRHHAEGSETIELHPTYRALIDTILDAGFKELIEVTGESESPHDLYASGVRRCIIALK